MSAGGSRRASSPLEWNARGIHPWAVQHPSSWVTREDRDGPGDRVTREKGRGWLTARPSTSTCGSGGSRCCAPPCSSPATRTPPRTSCRSPSCAARHWHRVDPGAVDAYVRRVMYTRSVDAWRWRRRQPDPVDTSGVGRPTGRTDGSEELTTRLTLLDALSRLTPRQRAVLVARFYEDRTEADTARVSWLFGEHREVTDPPFPGGALRVRLPSSPTPSAVRSPSMTPPTDELSRMLRGTADRDRRRAHLPGPDTPELWRRGRRVLGGPGRRGRAQAPSPWFWLQPWCSSCALLRRPCRPREPPSPTLSSSSSSSPGRTGVDRCLSSGSSPPPRRRPRACTRLTAVGC